MPAYKDEKTGKWYSKLDYTNSFGEHKQKLKRGFLLKRDAEAWERDFLQRVKGSPDMPFSSMCDLYLEDKKAHTKASSYAAKRQRVNKWIKPYLGDLPTNKIDAAAVRAWELEMKQATTGSGRPLSPGYLMNIIVELSSIFNYAVKIHDLPSNPVHKAGNMIGKKTKSVQFWTYEQYQEFAATFAPDDPYKVFFDLLYYTGLRKGELFALTPADIDLAQGTVSVSKTFNVIDGKTVITEPKTARSKRVVTIPAFLCDEIRSYEEMIYGLDDEYRIFQRGKTTLANQLRSHAAAAGLPVIRIHDLRHSHASHLIDLGFSIVLISERLGHENVSITLDTYSHLFPNRQAEVADKLEELHSGKDAALKQRKTARKQAEKI